MVDDLKTLSAYADIIISNIKIKINPPFDIFISVKSSLLHLPYRPPQFTVVLSSSALSWHISKLQVFTEPPSSILELIELNQIL